MGEKGFLHIRDRDIYDDIFPHHRRYVLDLPKDIKKTLDNVSEGYKLLYRRSKSSTTPHLPVPVILALGTAVIVPVAAYLIVRRCIPTPEEAVGDPYAAWNNARRFKDALFTKIHSRRSKGKQE